MVAQAIRHNYKNGDARPLIRTARSSFRQMIIELNNFIRRLWCDDDGVVLALTAVVYLTLFVIACSVYAVGEHLRNRIILQNAADAAAYSAAVVQAEAISRIAAINRAMAWNYAQVCKMKREYILDEWIRRVYREWYNNYNSMSTRGTTRCGEGLYRWYAGRKKDWEGKEIRINGTWYSASEFFDRMNAVPNEQRYEELEERINLLLSDISEMNVAEEAIIATLSDAIDATFRHVCGSNLDNGSLTLFRRRDPDDYFEILPSTMQCEEEFLRYAVDNNPENEFGPGTNEWFNLQEPSNDSGGFSRNYSGNLFAKWYYGYEKWKKKTYYYYVETPSGQKKTSYKKCTKTSSDYKERAVYAERYDVVHVDVDSVFARPQRLTPGFFAGDGTLVAAVAMPLRNPLTIMLAAGGKAGIFSFFEPPAKSSQYMWAVSAARAGYRAGAKEGAYAIVRDHEDLSDDWDKVNLSEMDWDAVLLPLRRARSTYGANSTHDAWQHESASAILSDLWSANDWQPVGGGSMKSVNTNSSGGPNYGDAAINKLVWH